MVQMKVTHGLAVVANEVRVALGCYWDYVAFSCLSDRFCFLDIDSLNSRLRVVGVYMSHSGHDDAFNDAVYFQIDEVVDAGQKQAIPVVLAGDFNAQIGQRVLVESDEVVSQNGRGKLLADWCLLHRVEAANATSVASTRDLWTFQQKDSHKQLDYVLVDLVHNIDILDRNVLSDSVQDQTTGLLWLLYFSLSRFTRDTAKRKASHGMLLLLTSKHIKVLCLRHCLDSQVYLATHRAKRTILSIKCYQRATTLRREPAI